jgi:transcriptional regulator with XRE-family HTH domain
VPAEIEVSIKELAESIGVTEGTVSTWCRNLKQPKMETIFKIARFMNVEPSDLLRYLDTCITDCFGNRCLLG